MSFTNALAAEILDEKFGDVALASRPTWFIGVSTTTPAEDGTNFTEPGEASYARVAVTNNLTNFPSAGVADPATKANGTAITFPQALEIWAAAADFTFGGMFAAASGGVPLSTGALGTPRSIVIGEVLEIPIGDLDITLD